MSSSWGWSEISPDPVMPAYLNPRLRSCLIRSAKSPLSIYAGLEDLCTRQCLHVKLQKLTISIVGAFIRFHPFQFPKKLETFRAIDRPVLLGIQMHDLVHEPCERTIMPEYTFFNADFPDVPQIFPAEYIRAVAVCRVRKIAAEDEIPQMVKGDAISWITEGDPVIRMRKSFDIDDHCVCRHNPSGYIFD